MFKKSRSTLVQQINKVVISIFLIGVILVSPLGTHRIIAANSFAETRSDEYLALAADIIAWKKSSLGLNVDEDLLGSSLLEHAGTSVADWYAIGLSRLGFADDYFSYYAVLERNIFDRYQTESGLDSLKATEWQRSGLAVLAAGGDPTNVADGTINLLADGSYDRGKTLELDAQGLSGLVWGLILMDSLRYDIPSSAHDSRVDVIVSILAYQQEDGGFGPNDVSSIDLSLMAIQALAPYYNEEDVYVYERNADRVELQQSVSEVINKSLAYLSSVQQVSGGFLTNAKEESAETNAQAILALCSLGISLSDERFVKDGNTIYDALLAFRQLDGGFAHSLSETDQRDQVVSNDLASQQALLALAALARSELRLRTIYDFRPEASAEIKEQIRELEARIEDLGADATLDDLERIYEVYLDLPAEERSYVRNYRKLATARTEQGLENTSGLLKAMEQNLCGKGSMTNLVDGKEIELKVDFTAADAVEARALTMPLGKDDSLRLIVLLAQIREAGQETEYLDVVPHLLEMQRAAKVRAEEIEEINGRIVDLYPIEELGLKDYERVYELVALIEPLLPSEREQISGLADVATAKSRVDGLKRGKIVALVAILVLSIAVMLLLLLFNLSKKKRTRHHEDEKDQR